MAADQEKVQALLDKIHKAGERTDVELYRIKLSYEATIGTLAFVADLIPMVKDAETITPGKLRASQSMVKLVCDQYNTDIDNLDDVIKTEIENTTKSINFIKSELNDPNRKYSGLYPYIVDLLYRYGLSDTAVVGRYAEIFLNITNTDFVPLDFNEFPTIYKKIPKLNDEYNVIDDINDVLATLPIYANELKAEEDDEIREKIKNTLYRRVIYTAVENWVNAGAAFLDNGDLNYKYPEKITLPTAHISKFIAPGLAINKESIKTRGRKTAHVITKLNKSPQKQFEVDGFKKYFGIGIKNVVYSIYRNGQKDFTIEEVCNLLKGNIDRKSQHDEFEKQIADYLSIGSTQRVWIDDTADFIAAEKAQGREVEPGTEHYTTGFLFPITPQVTVAKAADGQQILKPYYKFIEIDGKSIPPELEYLELNPDHANYTSIPTQTFEVYNTNYKEIEQAEKDGKKPPALKIDKSKARKPQLDPDKIGINVYIIERIHETQHAYDVYKKALKSYYDRIRRNKNNADFKPIDKPVFKEIDRTILIDTVFNECEIDEHKTTRTRMRSYIKYNLLPSLQLHGYIKGFELRRPKGSKTFDAILIKYDL